MQTKLESLFEQIANQVFGFFLAYLVGMIIFPLYGIPITPMQNIEIVTIFTLVSIFRGYVFRRYFNWRVKCQQKKFVS